MNVGDPKKAAVLGAVAIVIVGVAIFQIVPKNPQMKAVETVRAEGQAAAATEKKTNESLPTVLTSEPFAKPKVAAKKDQGAQAPADGDKSATPNSSGTAPVVPAITGSIPGVGVTPEGNETKANPGENTGSSQQIKSEHPGTLTFNGVMDIGGRKAILTINGRTQETIECKVGQMVAGYKVLEITSNSITLQRDIDLFTLEPGSAHPL